MNQMKCNSLQDFFMPLSQRKEQNAFFCRISGYNTEVEKFLPKYSAIAQRCGALFLEKIPNPTEQNLTYYREILGDAFQMNADFIEASLKKWLPRLSNSMITTLSDNTLEKLIVLRQCGKNEVVLKNVFTKYMCWFYYRFENILLQLGNDSAPKILMGCSVSQQELFFLSLLAKSGCDVLLLEQNGEQAYLKLDPMQELSEKYELETPQPFPPQVFTPDGLKHLQAAKTQQPQNSFAQNTISTQNESSNTQGSKANRKPLNIRVAGTAQPSRQTVTSAPIKQPATSTQSVAPSQTSNTSFHFKTAGQEKPKSEQPAPQRNLNGQQPHFKVSGAKKTEHPPVRMYGGQPTLTPCTNAWMKGNGLEDFHTPSWQRGKENNFFYNCYVRINGCDNHLTWQQTLASFYQEMQRQKRSVTIVDGQIPSPQNEEIAQITRNTYADCNQLVGDLSKYISYPSNLELQKLMCRAFADCVEEISETVEASGVNANVLISRITNKAVILLCWIRRYQQKLFHSWTPDQLSLFIHMGACMNDNECVFMKFLSRIPVDVLILVPNLGQKCRLTDSLLFEVNYEDSASITKFPVMKQGARVSTLAYNAEKDVTEFLMNDTGIYRNMQHSFADSVTLRSTFEEIKIYWNQPLQFRTGFAADTEHVTMPVFMAKISGIKDEDQLQYWQCVKEYVDTSDIYVPNTGIYDVTSANPIARYTVSFLKQKRLQRKLIRENQFYAYGFLREEMQEHILNKLQALIDSEVIRGTYQDGTENMIIAVVLHMPQQILRLLQCFDFTKKNPKIVYVNTTTRTISKQDAILLAFLNLVGFDILYFIPTGYQIVENFYNKPIVEEHRIGSYVFDLSIPNLDTLPKPGAFSRLGNFFRK